MYRLNCAFKNNEWGRIGHRSKVAQFKLAMDSNFNIDENEHYAELWMGQFKSKKRFYKSFTRFIFL